MKNAIVLFLVLGLIVTACNSNTEKSTSPAEITTVDTTSKAGAEAQAVDELYACSMHPEVTGKKDEACSKCGMKLTVAVKKSDTLR